MLHLITQLIHKELEHIQEKDLDLRTPLVLMNTLLMVVAVVVMILDPVVNQEHLQPVHQVAVVLDKITQTQIHIILPHQTVKQELVVSQHHLMELEPGLDMQILVE